MATTERVTNCRRRTSQQIADGRCQHCGLDVHRASEPEPSILDAEMVWLERPLRRRVLEVGWQLLLIGGGYAWLLLSLKAEGSVESKLLGLFVVSMMIIVVLVDIRMRQQRTHQARLLKALIERLEERRSSALDEVDSRSSG